MLQQGQACLEQIGLQKPKRMARQTVLPRDDAHNLLSTQPPAAPPGAGGLKLASRQLLLLAPLAFRQDRGG